MLTSTGSTVIASSYLSEDDAMLGEEAQYCRMEQELQRYLDNYESTHDYDEYHFDLDDIEHDPYAVSYTHLDVYKRQKEDSVNENHLSPDCAALAEAAFP